MTEIERRHNLDAKNAALLRAMAIKRLTKFKKGKKVRIKKVKHYKKEENYCTRGLYYHIPSINEKNLFDKVFVMFVQKNAKYSCEVRSHIMLTTGIHHFAINGNSNAIYFYYSIKERITYVQLRAKQTAPLVDKHYQNEVTLTGQNPSLICCPPLKILTHFITSLDLSSLDT